MHPGIGKVILLQRAHFGARKLDAGLERARPLRFRPKRGGDQKNAKTPGNPPAYTA
jgi:hypothetical protein